jgi:triacylglycerol esterase/lipase EstA (alpha/beta hydrolase family)
LNWYTYAGNNPLVYIDPNGLEAKLQAHGLWSSGETWEDMNERLKKMGDFEIGGIIIGGDEFVNKNLFSDEEWDTIKKEIKDLSTADKRKILQPLIQARVAELDEQGIDVLFMITFSNNQDDFRKQGAELKKAIDLVKPKGQKVDVLAHSMGSLAAASYIAGISGVAYENDIDKFIAIGAPFGGSSWANWADALGDKLQGRFRRSGDAYHNLRPGSEAINELQTAWNSNYGSLTAPFGVRFYSLQSKPGDAIVSWGSSTSLKGSINVKMPIVFHSNQLRSIYYQSEVYNILTGKSIFHDRSIPDPLLPW